MILFFGAFLGLSSVLFGTYLEHDLKENINAEHYRNLMTALRYNQIHAVVISAIGMVLINGGKLSVISAFKWSGKLFVLGTFLFSFSIYISISLDIPKLVYLTPFGGITIMVSWLTLLIAGIQAYSRSTARYKEEDNQIQKANPTITKSVASDKEKGLAKGNVEWGSGPKR